MKIFTMADVLSKNPCLDPTTFGDPSWRITVLDACHMVDRPPMLRLWFVKNSGELSSTQWGDFNLWMKNFTENRSALALPEDAAVTQAEVDFKAGNIPLANLKTAIKVAELAFWGAVFSELESRLLTNDPTLVALRDDYTYSAMPTPTAPPISGG